MGHEAGPGWTHLEAEQRRRLPIVDQWWDLLGRPVGARIADVGCGPGLFAQRLAALGADVLAVDVRPEAIARVPQGPGLRALVHDLQDTPLPRPVDVAILADVLHHVARPDDLLGNLRRCARRLLVAEAAGHGGHGRPRLSPSQLARLLDAADFTAGATHVGATGDYVLLADARA